MNIWTQDNACDYGHYADEIRRLPISEDATLYVCYRHYQKEMTEETIAVRRSFGYKPLDRQGRPIEWKNLPIKGREE